MSEFYQGLSSVTPRLVRWIKALDIDPESVPSYHSQTEFWLDVEPTQRIFVEVAADGALYLLAPLFDVMTEFKSSDLTVQSEKQIHKALYIIEQLATQRLVPDVYQPCIKQDQFGIMLVTSVDNTLNAKAAMADLCATAAIIAQHVVPQ